MHRPKPFGNQTENRCLYSGARKPMARINATTMRQHNKKHRNGLHGTGKTKFLCFICDPEIGGFIHSPFLSF